MRPLVLHETTAEVLFWVSFALWFAMDQWVSVRSGVVGRISRDWTYTLLVVVLVASIVVGIVLAGDGLAPLPGPAWWPVAAGLVVMWAGMALRLWAILTLGSFFKVEVVIQEDHRVVDYGPYRRLRHPSYTGMLCAAVGMGLAEGDWLSIAVMLVFPLTALLIRIQVVERALLSALGADYAEYARRTARLVPGVY
jgi:protein-S-isoprenylcysteine O-methyltransferase Ste14